ncbi:MAG: hypothetical protein V8R80_01730 [Eubacterium sp.]
MAFKYLVKRRQEEDVHTDIHVMLNIDTDTGRNHFASAGRKVKERTLSCAAIAALVLTVAVVAALLVSYSRRCGT